MYSNSRTTKPCDLCGHDDFAPLWHRGHPGVLMSTVVCTKCGLVQTNPAPGKTDLDQFYRHQYRVLYNGSPVPNEASRRGMAKQAASRCADLDRHLKRASSVLEIGCATGEFLAQLKEHGHSPVGIELSPDCAAVARQICNDVRTGMVEDQTFAEATFDAICMFHVLEHLESPRTCLLQLRQWLKTDGILFLEVPDVHQPYEGHLNRFFQIAHLYTFSERTLTAMLGVAGFQCLWSRRLVEGKFLRIVAQMMSEPLPGAYSLPADDWKQVKSMILAWRRRWLVWYKWKSLINQYGSAIGRRMRSSRPT